MEKTERIRRRRAAQMLVVAPRIRTAADLLTTYKLLTIDSVAAWTQSSPRELRRMINMRDSDGTPVLTAFNVGRSAWRIPRREARNYLVKKFGRRKGGRWSRADVRPLLIAVRRATVTYRFRSFDDALTAREVGNMMDVSEQHVRNLVDDAALGARVERGQLVIPYSCVLRFLIDRAATAV
jgi:hypothetical protein